MEDLKSFMNVIVDPETEEIIDYRHLVADEWTCKTWEWLVANKFGRLMTGQPRKGIVGTETMEVIFVDEVPRDRKATYARFCCNYREQKEEKH